MNHIRARAMNDGDLVYLRSLWEHLSPEARSMLKIGLLELHEASTKIMLSTSGILNAPNVAMDAFGGMVDLNSPVQTKIAEEIVDGLTDDIFFDPLTAYEAMEHWADGSTYTPDKEGELIDTTGMIPLI